jgi:hypothetical protein
VDVDRDAGDAANRFEAALGEVGGQVHRYPQEGEAVRRVVLRDLQDEGGSRYLVAALEHDGVIRVSGRDAGPAVARFWGSGISTYEWVYVVAPDRTQDLVLALGGERGDDVLSLLAARCEQGEDIEAVLRSPEVGADFSNWHS